MRHSLEDNSRVFSNLHVKAGLSPVALRGGLETDPCLDLAAERAMREARAAARGQVEDIRAGETDHAAQEKSHQRGDTAVADESGKRTTAHPIETENFKQHVPGYDPPQTALEAVQEQYAGAAR